MPNGVFTEADRERLGRHVINLRDGMLSDAGTIRTRPADVDRLFGELLPAELEECRRADRPLRLVFYAHGGLVREHEGIGQVLRRLDFWRRNHVYPVFFVWETGVRETVADIIGNLWIAIDRGLIGDVTDAALERVGRPGGLTVWRGMKLSAARAVQTNGGARLVARQTREFWNRHHTEMEIHAVGHSAGAIFQAHFLPCLTEPGAGENAPPLAVTGLHLLAPAATTALFQEKLAGSIGGHGPIRHVTIYTMREQLERDDRAGPYRKSLLYFVRNAFEELVPTPLLGLESDLNDDLRLIRFFGLAGPRNAAADILFSETSPEAQRRDQTTARRHGGFDNDASTMNSVMRRILDAADTDAIVEFPRELETDAFEAATVKRAAAGGV